MQIRNVFRVTGPTDGYHGDGKTRRFVAYGYEFSNTSELAVGEKERERERERELFKVESREPRVTEKAFRVWRKLSLAFCPFSSYGDLSESRLSNRR